MICLTIILCLLTASPRFISYSAADGLPSNTVYAITQDTDGVLWVGTRNGLASFDGSRFKSHKEYGRVNALAVDTEGRLWVGTTEGLTVMPDQVGHDGGPVRALYADKEGFVWATVGDSLLLKLSYHGGIREEARCFYDKRDHEGDYPYFQIYEAEDGKLSAPRLYWDSGRTALTYDRQREHKAAEWVLQNNHAAGATTDVMSDVNCLYFALRVLDRVYGVIGIEAGSDPLDSSEQGILLSILGECALALENEKNTREKEAAAVLAESEQLRANLLRTISHDLRTPLTSISGNASNLLTNGSCFDEETKQQIYRDIYNDSLWLINLVENLLYATRIEEGRMTLTRTPELVSEILEDAVRHMSRSMEGHPVTASYGEEMLLVKADAKLIVQVIANIMDNAVKYTPPGTPVTLMAERAGNKAEIRIADTGSGIPDEEKEKIFEKFYSGNHRIADNRRSIGLGLYLCRAIVEAHGGTIHVEDNRPSGAVFVFTLPLEETSDYE